MAKPNEDNCVDTNISSETRKNSIRNHLLVFIIFSHFANANDILTIELCRFVSLSIANKDNSQ